MYTREKYGYAAFAVLLMPVLLGGCKAGGQTESGAGKKEKEMKPFFTIIIVCLNPGGETCRHLKKRGNADIL